MGISEFNEIPGTEPVGSGVSKVTFFAACGPVLPFSDVKDGRLDDVGIMRFSVAAALGHASIRKARSTNSAVHDE